MVMQAVVGPGWDVQHSLRGGALGEQEASRSCPGGTLGPRSLLEQCAGSDAAEESKSCL